MLKKPGSPGFFFGRAAAVKGKHGPQPASGLTHLDHIDFSRYTGTVRAKLGSSRLEQISHRAGAYLHLGGF